MLDTGAIFESFVSAGTLSKIQQTFQQLCLALEIDSADGKNVYRNLRRKLKDWRAEKLFFLLDKRVEQAVYKKQTAAERINALIIGCGPCGLRTAIELALLGCTVMVVEQREKFSRNNVLHLWEFVIHDLKTLGAKIFYPKFCTGSIEHISIRQLQCLLLKVALLLGVQVHEGVSFLELVHPEETTSGDVLGFRAQLDPAGHFLSSYEFDVLIGADGKRNTVPGFSREEMRGKLAIAITANFVNNKTAAEERVPEISGVAYIFNQSFFKEMYASTGVDLENIVYYKDETHYFVMCAKKQSLLDMDVIKEDFDDAKKLLDSSNVDMEALGAYARAAAEFATHGKLPALEFAKNHHGIEDISMFDFTSLYSAKHSVRFVERKGKTLLMGIVGDSLHEPFWPTGSGCARGFLGVFDTAWLIRDYGINQRAVLSCIADRESIFRLLPQVTKDNMHKGLNKYTIDPKTRYVSPDLPLQWQDVKWLCSSDDKNSKVLRGGLVTDERFSTRFNLNFLTKYSLWRFCQAAAISYKLWVYDFDICWRDGNALAALVAKFRPESMDLSKLLSMENPTDRLKVIFSTVEEIFGIHPVCSESYWPNTSVNMKIDYISLIVEVLRRDKEIIRKAALTPRSQSSLKRKLPLKPIQATRRRTQPIELLAQNLLRCSSFANDVQIPNAAHELPNDVIPKRNVIEVSPIKEKSSRPKLKSTELSNMQRRLLQAGLQMNQSASTDKAMEQGKSTNARASDMRDIVAPRFVKKEENGVKMPDDAVNVLNLNENKLRGKTSCPVSTMLDDNMRIENASVESVKRHSVSSLQSVDIVPSRQTCQLCNQVVYAMERMQVGEMVIHKHCFRCTYCNQPLRIGEYGKDKDLEYRYPHRLFCQVHLRIPLRDKISKLERSVRKSDSSIRETITAPATHIEPTYTPPVAPEPRPFLNFFSPEQLRDSTTSKLQVASSMNEVTGTQNIRTPERAEFGSHLASRSSTSAQLTRISSSDSDNDDFQTCRSNLSKEDDDSMSDCEDLEEEELDILHATVLEIADNHPEAEFSDEVAKSILGALNERRQMDTPNCSMAANDSEQFSTPTTTTSSRVRSRSDATPLGHFYYASPDSEAIRMRKMAELEEIRLNSRARARSKTDAELGISENVRVIPTYPSREVKPRSCSLVEVSASCSKLCGPTEPFTLTETAQNNKNSGNILNRIFNPNLASHRKAFHSPTVKADSVYCDSKKETSILSNPFRKLRIRREVAMKDMDYDDVSAACSGTIPKCAETPIVAVAPSRRISDAVAQSSELAPLPVNDKSIQKIKKKSERIIKRRNEEQSRAGQEIERSIQNMEVRMEEIQHDGERMENTLKIALAQEQNILKDAIDLAHVQLYHLQLQVRYRELMRDMRNFEASGEMAPPDLVQKILDVVNERSRIDKSPAQTTKKASYSSLLREKNYDFRNMQPVFKRADVDPGET